jgi:hypothetical protein
MSLSPEPGWRSVPISPKNSDLNQTGRFPNCPSSVVAMGRSGLQIQAMKNASLLIYEFRASVLCYVLCTEFVFVRIDDAVNKDNYACTHELFVIIT